jgi:hypothetical protein
MLVLVMILFGLCLAIRTAAWALSLLLGAAPSRIRALVTLTTAEAAFTAATAFCKCAIRYA